VSLFAPNLTLLWSFDLGQCIAHQPPFPVGSSVIVATNECGVMALELVQPTPDPTPAPQPDPQPEPTPIPDPQPTPTDPTVTDPLPPATNGTTNGTAAADGDVSTVDLVTGWISSNRGMVIGVSVGAVLIAIALTVLIVFIVRRVREHRRLVALARLTPATPTPAMSRPPPSRWQSLRSVSPAVWASANK
jgi:hypothetical protein